jgi:Ulp1 family protease
MQVFLPINIKECHWYLAVVCAKLFEVHVLDSMGLLMFNRDDLKKIVSNYAWFDMFLLYSMGFNYEMMHNYHGS